MAIILAFTRLRQEDLEFKASLGATQQDHLPAPKKKDSNCTYLWSAAL
jgi:hypothetical protein